MKICVFGAGAVGGHIAARLAAHGHQVSVVARGAHLQAMTKNGVKLLAGDETIKGPASVPRGTQEAVFVTLKANNLAAFADAAAPLLAPDTAVVFVQNGIPWWYGSANERLDPHGELRKAVPMKNVIGAVAYSSNEVVEPGVIRNHTAGDNMLVLGEVDDRESARVDSLRKMLEEAGMSSPATKNIRAVVWAKLLNNLSTSTLCTITEGTVGAVRSDPALVKLAASLAAEARAVAQALGVDPAQAPARPRGGQSSGLTAHKPSMLQDYERNRPMEVESQVMAPLALARQAGVATPALDAIAALVAHKAAARGLYKLQ
jgi:2-dehydropantoate 2-reductase